MLSIMQQLDDLGDANEQLQCRISALVLELDKAKEDVELERDTTAMTRSKAERDLKLQNQVTFFHVDVLTDVISKIGTWYIFI